MLKKSIRQNRFLPLTSSTHMLLLHKRYVPNKNGNLYISFSHMLHKTNNGGFISFNKWSGVDNPLKTNKSKSN